MSPHPLKTRKIISIQRPGLWVLSVFSLILLVVLSVWLAYDYGRNVAGFDRVEASQAMDELYQQIQQMKLKNDEIQQHNAMLERNSQIDDDAGSHLQMTFSDAQSEVHELKKELEFYKSIITPGKTKRNVVIQAVALQKLEDGRFKYKITISQKGRNDNFAKGVIKVAVIGQQEGKPMTLQLHEVSKEAKKITKFGFKYFQNFEGTMSMPDQFWPEYMQVQVKPKSRQIEAVKQQYAWSDLTAGGAQYVGQQ